MIAFDPEHHLTRLGKNILDRRSILKAGIAMSSMASIATVVKAVMPPLSVPDYRYREDTDDTAAVNRALEAGGSIYFPAGKGSGPNGVYLLRAIALRSDIKIFGDGPHSILRSADPDEKYIFFGISKTVEDPLKNIAIYDLRVEGLVTKTGFREHWNLISFSGVIGLKIERVEFIGFSGDGLYLGAEIEGAKREFRPTRDVMVTNCLFDGVTGDNRNGISIISGSDILIYRCHFRRCTRANMPGPIDFEPDAFPFYSLARLQVVECDFNDCGGNVGQIALVVPTVVPMPHDILIKGNRFQGYRGTGGEIVITINREPSAQSSSMNCVIEDNIGVEGYSGVQIYSGKGIAVRNNQWTRYKSRSFLGYPEQTAGVINVSISDRFDGCGWEEGVALAVYKGDGVQLTENVFTHSGNNTPGSAPLYLGPGRLRRLTMIRNDFRNNPASRGLITVERGTDYISGSSHISGNFLPEGSVFPTL